MMSAGSYLTCKIKIMYPIISRGLNLRLRHFFSIATCFFSVSVFAADWQYTLRPGDSIWTVCKEYTSYTNCWRELPAYNKLDKPVALPIGTQIKIPAAWLKQAPIAAQVVFSSGEVLIGAVGSQAPLQAGYELKIGDIVETRDGYATLQFVDGSILSMSSNSIVELDAVSAFRQKKSAEIKVGLPKGEVGIKVPSRNPRTRFDVRTPSAVAAVRGTEFRVHADSNAQNTRSEVLEGRVALAANSSEVALDAGFGALAESGKNVSEPVQLLSAPAWNLSCTDPGYAEWQSLPGASHYKLQLMEDSTERDNLLATKTVSNSNFTFKNLEEKCYQLKVSAVDEQGFTGMESRRQFCYELQLDTPVIASCNWVNSSMNVSWSPVKYAESYRLEVSSDAEFKNRVLDKIVSADQLSESLPGFAGEAYVRVSALAGDRSSDLSEAVAVKHESQRGWLIGLLAAIAAFAIL